MMTALLVGLALFNLCSMATVLAPRAVPRKAVPWALFAFALLATELAWIWLPLQAALAALFVAAGALQSLPGKLALLVLLLTWPVLAWSIRLALKADSAVRDALDAGLGEGFATGITDAGRERLRERVRFADWRRPFGWRRSGIEVLRNIPYANGGMRQRLDIYRPRQRPAGGCPVLLQIHGGAWVIGDKTHQALPLMHHLAARGWICVAANYRLSPSVGFPTHLEDCKRALCWIREHGREYGMNPDFVAVTGGSAGGHLAALMGLTANRPELQRDHPATDTSVQACVPFYGIYDFLTRFEQHPNRQLIREFLDDRVMHQTPEENPALWDLASPVMQIHEDAPPFMVVHGSLDSLAAPADARTFAQRLRRVSRNPVVFLELPGAEHGFDCMHSARTEHTIDGVQRFLEWSLAQQPVRHTEQQPEQQPELQPA
jgi:acetyl esterase/lipase